MEWSWRNWRGCLPRTAPCKWGIPKSWAWTHADVSFGHRSLDDELVYQTRVKPITSSPIFNAGTERFVKDWRSAHVSVTVKDSRMREKDAVLGVVMLKVHLFVSNVVPTSLTNAVMQLSDLLVNASQITRLYSIEQGLGYGRIRLSLLFRPVEAKLPMNLLGFDTGTLMVQDVTVKVDDDNKLDLSKCELRMKTTKPNHEVKVSRKAGQKRDDGSIAWSPDGDETHLKGLPVRTRYSSALMLAFKDASVTAGLKGSGPKALAVLWLREIADNDERTLDIPLWHVSDGDYSRLKMNYSPPDGNLDAWDDDKKKVSRVGSVRVHLTFTPGIGEGHHDTMNGGGAKRKEAWEAYTREKTGGLRDAVGEIGPDKREEASRPENLAETHTAGSESSSHQHSHADDNSESDSATYSASSLGTPDSESEGHRPQLNTEVSTTAVENEEINRHPDEDDWDGDVPDDGSSESGEKKGVVQKFKDWRQHEKELHREHRGIMQVKPARTVEWLKDNVEEGAHAVKERFSMKNRKPDVETEV